ncbi:YceH family protein [Chitinimonas sp.]|uniref:YceH family protein n=1 Tax=Chitinimonas sp. TaxID=1934313 RepID=UPI0035ADF706
MTTLSPLSLLETRILGVLVEKQRTVPDTYPLSLNALQAGCNQKTSRDPVMDASEADIAEALASLKQYSLIIETSGSRVTRFAHNMERVLGVPSQSIALLAVLMLRGPQTAGELRINCERLHKFADISAVEGFLHELAARQDGSLVQELPRQPGARENRWCQLLAGAPALDSQPDPSAAPGADKQQLEARVSQLETELAELKTMVERLSAALGGV